MPQIKNTVAEMKTAFLCSSRTVKARISELKEMSIGTSQTGYHKDCLSLTSSTSSWAPTKHLQEIPEYKFSDGRERKKNKINHWEYKKVKTEENNLWLNQMGKNGTCMYNLQ